MMLYTPIHRASGPRDHTTGQDVSSETPTVGAEAAFLSLREQCLMCSSSDGSDLWRKLIHVLPP